MNSCIRELRVGARIQEAVGRKRAGRIDAFDLDTGRIDATIDLVTSPEVTSHRYTNPRYPLSGPAKIKLTVREVLRGEWRIG